MSDWTADNHWASKFMPQIRERLSAHAGRFIEFQLVQASEEDDQKRCVDAHLVAEIGDIALRMRRGTKYEDLTLRSSRDTGTKTELAKLRDGIGPRYYFYAWIENGTIAKWMLVDIEIMRKNGMLFDERGEIANGDGTYFVAYSSGELALHECIVVANGLVHA